MKRSERGRWAGYMQHRQGRSGKKLALPRLFDREETNRLVARVIDNLSTYQRTPFENEADVRAGLRSFFCLAGHSWTVADNEAEKLLLSAFQKMGVKRPTWDEGQRQFVIARENCTWCNCDLDRTQLDRKQRFCSEVCAKAALAHYDWERVRKESAIAVAATKMLSRAKNPPRTCDFCGLDFFPRNYLAERYCSERCKAESQVKLRRCCAYSRCKKEFYPLSRGNQFYCSAVCRSKAGKNIKSIEISCEQCRQTFHASREDARFCGQECRDTHRSNRKAEAAGRPIRRAGDEIIRVCDFCGDMFTAHSPRANYCLSTNCRTMAQAFRSPGGWRPSKLSRPLFDHLFTVPINRDWKPAAANGHLPILTPELFDSWFKRAA